MFILQVDLKNTIIKMKKTLSGINNKLANTEEQISDLEDKLVEINQSKQHNEKDITFKAKNCLRDLRDNIKHLHIHILRIPKRE